jgi:two-component system, NtrC family, response regulator AtoC
MSTHQHAELGLVAASPAMRAVLQWVERAAGGDHPVLLVGETGVGKELVARAIHARSTRCAEAFVPVNCGAIPSTLIEGELFGSRKGAFTGAATDRTGLLERAHRRTLFLDEIGELPLDVQPVLLRVLDSGESRRLGETVPRRLDIRIVSATNRSLPDEVVRGRFRRDLYYRLQVLTCEIPPLRERPDDLRLRSIYC